MGSKVKLRGIALLAIATLVPNATPATTPPDVLHYQGVLRDAFDDPLDGPYDMQFRFYSADVGGDWIMVDRHENKTTGPVTVTNGLFSVALGTGAVSDGAGPGTYTSLAEVFRDYGTVYLEVWVGVVDAGPETLSPRIPIRSAAYALNADHLDGWDSASFLRGPVSASRIPKSNGTTLEDSSIFETSGRIGIGTTTPARKLDVEGNARIASEARVEGLLLLTATSPGIEFPDGTTQSTAAAVHTPAPPCFDDANRYVDCGNGTVTDTVSGLIWLKDAGCLPTDSFADAHDSVLSLGEGQCGLTDGSAPGQWRMPTRAEWEDMTRQAKLLACPSPVLTDTTGYACWSAGDPFTNVGMSYWTTSAVEDDPAKAWHMSLTAGFTLAIDKTVMNRRPWPVRDP